MQRIIPYLVLSSILLSIQAPVALAEKVEQFCATTQASIKSPDPSLIYGVDRLSFEIFRGGSNVGTHQIEFTRQGSRLVVDSKTEIDVSILLISVYSYDYTSREVWCGDQLSEIETTVIENGEMSRVTASSTETGLEVLVNNQPEDLVATDIHTTNHWNSGVLSSNEVFNTITGRMNQIEITPAPVVDQNPQVTRYRIEGELNIAVAYDQEGRWVGLYFKDKRGAEIEFRCVQCSGDSSTYASVEP